MATINKQHLAILQKVVEAGYTSNKQIEQLGLADVAKMPRKCRVDLDCILLCIEAIKSKNLLGFLVTEDAQSYPEETADVQT